MRSGQRTAVAALLLLTAPLSAPLLEGQEGVGAQVHNPVNSPEVCDSSVSGSPYIPVDSWIYPAVWRLYSLGFLDNVYLGLRPWTVTSLSHMLEGADTDIEDAQDGPVKDEARRIHEAVTRELDLYLGAPCGVHGGKARVESVYTAERAVSGTPLRDSFHLGSTIVNDYGRPYAGGFNDYTGASGYATAGRFTVYLRGEFQGAPSATGYSTALAATLSCGTCSGALQGDQIPFLNPNTGKPYSQPTIPLGPIAATTKGSILEAYVSAQVLNHVISFGKQDEWLGPAQGASMAYSNNAENIYAFHINRIEPLNIPLLSQLTGPFRYEFLVGALRGHTLIPNPLYANNPSVEPNVISPGDPWVHVEKISFKPTSNVEFGFERTVLWGGEGHSPVNLHTFLRSFFSTYSPSLSVKNGPDDPGARFAAFDFTYRLPFVRNWLTLYTDSEAHDDVSPIDAPRRASVRPGLYLSHVPGLPKLDIRVEGVSTDPPTTRSNDGLFMYWEVLEKQGYTNQGQLFGDWMGREDKGGQGWFTYHLSGNEWVQAAFRHQKAAKDFIPGGTTLNDVEVQAVKRLGKDLELNANFTVEHWKVPAYLPGEQTVTTTNIQLTWFPERTVGF